MVLGYLISPVIQVENTNGKPLTGGWINVYRHGTTIPAVTYKDFHGDMNPQNIYLDHKGMCIILVDADGMYDVYCYDSNGVEQWSRLNLGITGGAGGAAINITSSDNSVNITKIIVGGVTNFDIKQNPDSTELLEWIRCDGAEKVADSDIYLPTFTDGTMAIGEKGIVVQAGQYYHVTAHVRATKNVTREPFYDNISIAFKIDDGEDDETVVSKTENVDYSLGLSQEFEVSTDVKPEVDSELLIEISGQDVLGGDFELLDVEVHRVYSGAPYVPSGVLSRAQAANLYQRQLIAGANITIEETEEGDIISATGGGGGGGATYQGGEGIVVNNTTYRISIDDSVVQEKLTAGDNISITNNVISANVPSVDISGKADKVEDAVDGNLAGLDGNGNLTDSGIAADRVVQDASYVHTDQNFTTEFKNKLTNIEAGAQVNVQSDWLEENSSSDAYIRNKPDMSQYITPSDISGKADKVYGAINGHLAGLDSTGNLTDSGIVASDVATQTDLADKQDVLTAGDNISITNNVISATAAAQQQADWNQQDNSQPDYIKNKPTIPSGNQLLPAATSADEDKVLTVDSNGDPVWETPAQSTQQQSDWAQTNNQSVDYIKNKPETKPILAGNGIRVIEYTDNITIEGTSAAQVQSDWTETDSNLTSYIQHKPGVKTIVAGANVSFTENDAQITISSTGAGGVPVQANWNQQDSSQLDYIKNKPTIPAEQVQSSWTETNSYSKSYIVGKPVTKPIVAGQGITITETATEIIISLT